MQTIYYCYDKQTGFFAGSGVTQIDNTTHGCTDIPNETRLDKWNGSAWVSNVVFSNGVLTINGVVYEIE